MGKSLSFEEFMNIKFYNISVQGNVMVVAF